MRATLAFNSLIIKNDIITRFENFNHRSHFKKKCQRLAQINVLLKKTKFTLLKSIYFHFMTSTKQMLVFFRTRLGKILIWQKSSATWESDFKINIHVLNEFKVNHKDNRMTSFLYPLKTSENIWFTGGIERSSFWCPYYQLYTFSAYKFAAFFVDFEQAFGFCCYFSIRITKST